ncbi:hypothetical protein SAMD00079811_20040 [Scytonema sp. HK-05]|nr:hypothetical protein SAMD00079811_20040 [Scytonema sp. HK-05]
MQEGFQLGGDWRSKFKSQESMSLDFRLLTLDLSLIYIYCAILLPSFPQAGFGPVERVGRTVG